ncbi:EG45-like domain containing protein 2 [Abeliophyllum distichum]|uniref:EG45-like domain containing protein 2 n=1 Tax=Abeliophyllum distichum TaxID=126358 RepID=A0ABD1R1H5_9LAMI
MSICFSSIVLAKQGTAVFYARPYVPSACYGYRDLGPMIAGDNPTVFDGGKVCGRRYKVRCLGGTNGTPNPCKNGEIIVNIVDLCTGCGANEINLSQDAFSKIANLKAGRVRVDYTQV